MRRILLMGNPNVGKSVFFSRLTGVDVISSNYPGTTISFTKGFTRIGDEKFEVIDVPGTYTLEPTCKAEDVACEILKLSLAKGMERGDLIINVLDATNLERNLYLTQELLEKRIPMVVALNMWDETKHKGISIDIKKLEELLGVPVVPTVAITGEGFRDLALKIKEAKIRNGKKHTHEERWKEIGDIIKRRHHRPFYKVIPKSH
ncbi:MAG: FeoB small GTPase domain-containing protein [Fervidobacterium sp.]